MVAGSFFKPFEEMRIDCHRALVADQEGVTVGPRRGDRIGGEVAAGAGLVLDDDAALQILGERLRENTGDRVRTSAAA